MKINPFTSFLTKTTKFIIIPIIASVFIVFFTFSCSNNSTSSTATTKSYESIRPYSPWVFRSVLDTQARMVTLALHEDLYAAYSTQTGAIYKTWKGNVLFEGAVYNTAHGPQPISIGDAYFINHFKNPWIVKKNGEIVSSEFQYKGHRFDDPDHATLLYELTLDGHKMLITESPDVQKDQNGKIVFKRFFTTKNIPKEYTISLKSNISSILSQSDFQSDHNLEVIKQTKREIENKSVIELDVELELKPNGSTTISATLSDLLLISNHNNELVSKQDLEDNIGKTLIEKNDCKSCHNTFARTIGPSYEEIAKKYNSTDADVLFLVGKIQKGGSGVWGSVPMTPHPELPTEDAENIVKYILSLDTEDDENTENKVKKPVKYYSPVDTLGEDLVGGALVKMYDISKTATKMPDFNSLKAKYGGVLQDFNNLSSDDFGDMDFDFGLVGEGFLQIEKEKEYTFRIWSDDGSKLYIDGELIIDNDGNHGVQYRENTIGLKKGFHSFRLEFYQGILGKFLSFNWKPKGKDGFEVVPPEVIQHKIQRHVELKGMTLPMSVTDAIPGDGVSLTQSHPSFDISQIRPDAFLPKVGGLDVMKDGRVILSTWDQEGGVYLVDYKNASSVQDITYKRIASGIAEPLGVKVVGDDIYVMQKHELTQLIDHDGDDVIDEYRTVSNSWDVSANFHEFSFGLAEKDDYLYATLAIGIRPGGASAKNQPKDRGKVLKIHRKTGETSFLAHGLRTPNGVAIGYKDDVFIIDNQGDWLPSSKILHVTEGAFFNSRAVDFEGTENLPVKAPVVWIPQNEIGNSPSTPANLNVGQYQDQMIFGDVTHGGLKRVFIEKIEGEYQGSLFRFSQGFEAGINRIVWADNKTLIVGGIGNPGNWSHNGKKWYGLQKFQFNNKETFEMLAVRAKTNGIEIEFTQALTGLEAWDPNSYSVSQWHYVATDNYGGPKVDVHSLEVISASVSEDKKRVFLEIPKIKEGYVVYVKLNDYFISNQDQDLWTTEAWYTMNKIPVNNIGKVEKSPPVVLMNALSEEEVSEGWKLLFDGKSTTGIRNFKSDKIGSSWKVENGELYLDTKNREKDDWQVSTGGDIIITDKEYENYELTLEWKISNCGNSGIIYNVVESDKYEHVWQTGPEMQILDNTCHPDTRYVTHRAGDLYDLIESKYMTVLEAGKWNKVRLVSKNGTIQHWLNGYKVVEYQNNNQEWTERIKKSKFIEMPDFGTTTKGHISLQDHGDPVYFRNIKIREL